MTHLNDDGKKRVKRTKVKVKREKDDTLTEGWKMGVDGQQTPQARGGGRWCMPLSFLLLLESSLYLCTWMITIKTTTASLL